MAETTLRLLILRVFKWSEADLIVHGLAPSGERVHLMARGALKSRKRFGGGILEPTRCIEAKIREARSPEGLATLLDARVIEDFSDLRRDYDRLHLALRLVDLVNRSSPGGELPGVFNLLHQALKALAGGKPVERVETQFALYFLKLHGVLEAETGLRDASELSEPQRRHLLERMNQFVATAESS